jgi:hypothetical protein
MIGGRVWRSYFGKVHDSKRLARQVKESMEIEAALRYQPSRCLAYASSNAREILVQQGDIGENSCDEVYLTKHLLQSSVGPVMSIMKERL